MEPAGQGQDEDLGVTQEQLAERLHVTQGAVAHWLGGRREPGLNRINQILGALHMPPLSIGGQAVQSSMAPDDGGQDADAPDGVAPMTIRESDSSRYEYEIEACCCARPRAIRTRPPRWRNWTTREFASADMP